MTTPKLTISTLYSNIDLRLPDRLSWITVEITNLPRFVHMEMNRHRVGISLTAKSTRFTFSKDMKTKDISQLVMDTNNDQLNDILKTHMKTIFDTVKETKLTSDVLKPIIPEGLLMDVVYTFNISALKHFIELRDSSAAHKEIRKVAVGLKEAYNVELEKASNWESGIISYTPVLISARAIHKCYATPVSRSYDKELNYVKRIGITLKHSSVLEHLCFRVEMDKELFVDLMYTSAYKFIYHGFQKDDIKGFVLLNMRILIDLYNSNLSIFKKLIPFIPKSYIALFPSIF